MLVWPFKSCFNAVVSASAAAFALAVVVAVVVVATSVVAVAAALVAVVTSIVALCCLFAAPAKANVCRRVLVLVGVLIGVGPLTLASCVPPFAPGRPVAVALVRPTLV